MGHEILEKTREIQLSLIERQDVKQRFAKDREEVIGEAIADGEPDDENPETLDEPGPQLLQVIVKAHVAERIFLRHAYLRVIFACLYDSRKQKKQR